MHDLALNEIEGEAGIPALVSLLNPLRSDQKDLSYAPFLPGETLGRYIERTGVRVASRRTNVWHNGRRVPSELWERLIPRHGDHVLLVPKMEGGGGNGKVLRTVAIIAVIAVSIMAPYMAPASWGMIGAEGAVTMGGALLSGAVMIGGGLIVSPLIPEISH